LFNNCRRKCVNVHNINVKNVSIVTNSTGNKYFKICWEAVHLYTVNPLIRIKHCMCAICSTAAPDHGPNAHLAYGTSKSAKHFFTLDTLAANEHNLNQIRFNAKIGPVGFIV
jgi:hypothetical protein